MDGGRGTGGGPAVVRSEVLSWFFGTCQFLGSSQFNERHRVSREIALEIKAASECQRAAHGQGDFLAPEVSWFLALCQGSSWDN